MFLKLWLQNATTHGKMLDVRNHKIKKQSKGIECLHSIGGWLTPDEGGDAMSVYETFVIIFMAMMFIIALIKLMILLADKFSQRK